MKIITSVLLFCSVSISIYSQEVNFFIDYYPWTEKAETAILNENYSSAHLFYMAAFKNVNSGFGIDYHNAMMCSMEIDSIEKAFEYLEILIAKGVEQESFTNNLHWYQRIIDDPKWAILMDDYAFYQYNSFGKTVNHTMRGEIGVLINRDQEFRSNFETYRDTIAQIDAQNISDLLVIFNNYGFPSEEEMGIRFTYSTRCDLYYYVLWHHIRNWRSDSTLVDVRPLILNAMKHGQLYIEEGCQYLDLASSTTGSPIGNYGVSNVIQIQGNDSTYFVIDYTDEQLSIIDKTRQIVGLKSLANFHKKQWYQIIQNTQDHPFKITQNSIDTYPKNIINFIKLKELKML